MFPAIEDELLRTEGSLVAYLELKSCPPVVVEEFSQEWCDDLIRKIGVSPFTSKLLELLGIYLKEIRGLQGYQHIKEKLKRLDDEFYPTLSEVEFIWLLLQKLPFSSINLEQTFATRKGSHPDLRVNCNLDPLYFDVTRIMDYREMRLLLRAFGCITTLQLLLKYEKGLDRKISLDFRTHPSKETLTRAVWEVYTQLQQGCYLFGMEKDSYTISISEGNEVALSIPPEVFKKKLKDKLDEKTRQFDEDTCNFVVVDVTPVIGNLDDLASFVEKYLDCTENIVIWGVVLTAKKWIFDSPLQIRWEMANRGVRNPRRNEGNGRKILDEFFLFSPE